jgi:nitroimidazol reductase NimA-like FMN-containing flavoprotein (pyridoxamine 5'-phosphate oxidase superfamily)
LDSIDEPALGKDNVRTEADGIPESPSLPERIRRLLEGELYGVLCTQGDQQPYGSVIAFAATEDLLGVVFATSRGTRKYHLLIENDRVALVVDNRGAYPGELMKVEAITATGRARPLPPGPARDQHSTLLITRHPHLREFINAPSTALFRIDITRFLHVARFQEVTQWVPKNPG